MTKRFKQLILSVMLGLTLFGITDKLSTPVEAKREYGTIVTPSNAGQRPLIYEISSIRLSGNNIRVEGWAVASNTQHHTGSSTHNYFIEVVNSAGRVIYTTPAVNPQKYDIRWVYNYNMNANTSFGSNDGRGSKFDCATNSTDVIADHGTCNYKVSHLKFVIDVPIDKLPLKAGGTANGSEQETYTFNLGVNLKRVRRTYIAPVYTPGMSNQGFINVGTTGMRFSYNTGGQNTTFRPMSGTVLAREWSGGQFIRHSRLSNANRFYKLSKNYPIHGKRNYVESLNNITVPYYRTKINTSTNPSNSGFDSYIARTVAVVGGTSARFTVGGVPYTVTYNANGGSGSVASQTVNYNTLLTPRSNGFTRTGYTFTGWNESANGGGTSWSPGTNKRYTKKGNMTLYAQWRINTYVASFDPNGGSPKPANQNVQYNGTVKTPVTPTRTGYTFAGWSPSLSTKITSNRTFTAQWNLNSYKVTFNSNGGSPIPSQTINHGSKVIKPSNPTRTGYTFVGWTPNIDSPITKETEFVAQWKLNEYTVKFDTRGGNSIPNQTVKHGSRVIKPNDPVKANHHFDGWTPDINKVITGPETFVAQWRQIFNVTFDLNGGEGSIPAQRVIDGELAKVPADPTRKGYNFVGWSPDITKPIKGNTVFKAQWDAKEYTLTYHPGGVGQNEASGAPISEKIKFDDTFTLRNKPESFSLKDHYFDGWDTKKDGSGTSWRDKINLTLKYTTDDNIDLYAQWERKPLNAGIIGDGPFRIQAYDKYFLYGELKGSDSIEDKISKDIKLFDEDGLTIAFKNEYFKKSDIQEIKDSVNSDGNVKEGVYRVEINYTTSFNNKLTKTFDVYVMDVPPVTRIRSIDRDMLMNGDVGQVLNFDMNHLRSVLNENPINKTEFYVKNGE